VAVNKPVIVQSVNGPTVTLIQGDHMMRCVYLTNGAALTGFTLTNGVTDGGGGVRCESTTAIVSNCVLIGNSAGTGGGALGGTLYNCTLTGNSATWGGGAFSCKMNNCILTANSVGDVGGGTIDCALNNCTLSGNRAANGVGGALGGTLNNCIVFYNVALNKDSNYYDDGTSFISHSCTQPLPTSGTGNLASAPLFLNQAGGNLRLQSNSPCINAGSNASTLAGPDLDGHPRIVGGTVDMGAYEYQSPQSLISYAWLQQYGLPTDGSADYTDADGDGLNNWQEWHTGTNPTDALSVLRLLSAVPAAPGVIVNWQSVSGRNYALERAAHLGIQPAFLPLATNIVGQAGTTTFTDTNTVGAGPYFYRVGVQE
jgi:hypothetical protein